ncbi:hydrophobin 2 [Mycena vulgaris]|nr:hydrophobin 2 [Mycena vulgaris]
MSVSFHQLNCFKMLSRLFHLIFLGSLLTGALAYPPGAVARQTGEHCPTGELLCCQDLVSANNINATISELLHDLGIKVNGTSEVGLTCTPVIGSSLSCDSLPVCCQSDEFLGVVAVGCTPPIV